MIYAKIDVDITDHFRAMEACELAGSLAPMGLWTWGVCYARKQKTDGELSRAVTLRAFGGHDVSAMAAILVTVGLWSVTRTGWVVERYRVKNDTREQIEESISRNVEKQRKFRSKKLVDVTGYTAPVSPVTPGSGSGSPSGYSNQDLDLPSNDVPPPGPPPARPPVDLFGASFLAEAYAEGQRAAGAEDYPAPRSIAAIRALDEMTHAAKMPNGEPLRGPPLAQWVRTTSEAYRKAKALSGSFERGYDPVKCLEWIRAGRPNDATPKAAFVRNAVPDTPKSPYHRQNAGYVRKKGEESVTPQQVGDLIAAIGKAQ